MGYRRRYKFVKVVKNARRGPRFANKVRKHFILIIFIAIIIIFGSAYIIWKNEMDSHESYSEAVWTVLFTLIGQGEFASNPKTIIGRIIVFIISIFGIAVLGVIFSEILQRIISSKFREMIGMSSCKYKGHTIICGWSERGRIMLKELTETGKEVAVIANDRPKSLPTNRVFFVSGTPVDQNILSRAGIKEAKAVVILSERTATISESETDAKTILVALAIQSMNTNVYTVVELINPDNEKYARLANVNDIIYGDQIIAEITATCATNQGISVFVRDILCATDNGHHLCTSDVPDFYNGKSVKELFDNLKTEGYLPIGLLIPPKETPNVKVSMWDSLINPNEDTIIELPIKTVCIVKSIRR